LRYAVEKNTCLLREFHIMTPEVRTPALQAASKPEAEFRTDEMNRLVRACILDVVAGLEQ
jgi:hypothetical protein